jgi:hypothetical protein
MTAMDYISQPDVDTHVGLGFAEEAALKKYLSDHIVPDKAGRQNEIPVYFRWPESERRMKYPFITIDLLSINPAYDKFHSITNYYDSPSKFITGETGAVREGYYFPSTDTDVANDGDTGYYIERYLPYTLMFQISSFARSITDDRFMTARFITDIFPPQTFFIGCDADNVFKRCSLLEWVTADTLETTEASKRIFRKIYTIAMETEVPPSKIYEYEKVSRVHADIYDKGVDQKLAVTHPYDSPAHSEILGDFTIEAPPSGP